MIGKLRFRFISVAMVSVTVVLGLLVAMMNVINFAKVYSNADRTLKFLFKSGGEISQSGQNQDEQNNQMPASQEEFFKIRYFAVIFDGSNYTFNLDNSVAISEDDALILAQKALGSKAKSGSCGVYRYLVADNGQSVIFVDCEIELNSANNFLRNSIYVSLIGLLLVFLLIFLFSIPVLHPVKDSYKKQKQFITNAAHELKTPLTIIALNNEMLEMTMGESEYTATISKQVARLTTMVQNLTSLAKLDEGNLRLDNSRISLSNICVETLENFKELLQVGDRELKFKIDDNATIIGDKNLIKQLVSILLDNANKYATGNIDFSLTIVDKKVSLVVSNDADVEAGDLSQCFERFYRTSASRGSNIEGSGIGLSLAKEIVALHQGKISARGTADKRFIIEITFKLEQEKR